MNCTFGVSWNFSIIPKGPIEYASYDSYHMELKKVYNISAFLEDHFHEHGVYFKT